MISRSDAARSLLLATAGALFFNIEPAIASTMGAAFHLPSAILGMVLATESAGAIAGSIVAFAVLPRTGARAFIAYALVLYVLANAFTLIAPSAGILAAARLFAGIAEGAVVAVAFAMISLGVAHRLFAAFGIFQTASMIAAFPLLAWLTRLYGWKAMFALFIAVGIASILALPSRTVALRDDRPRGGLDAASVRGLVSILVVFAAQAAIWPFLEHIGAQRGLGDFAVAGALSFGALCGLAGSFAVTLLPAQIAGFRACVIAALLNVAAIAAMAHSSGSAPFVIGLGSFNFAWALFAPLQLNVLKRMHAAPATFTLASTATTAGFTIGPAAGGFTIIANSYAIPLAIGIAGTFIALCLLLPSGIAQLRDPRQAAARSVDRI